MLLFLFIIFLSSFLLPCRGTELEGTLQYKQLHLGQRAIFVSEHINFVQENTKGQNTATILHGAAESLTHVADIVTEKDKKKKKQGFFKLLCAIFNTVLKLIAHHKDAKKSYDPKEYNLTISKLTGDFLEFIKDDQPHRVFTASPSYLYQFSFLKNQTEVEAAVIRVMQSNYKNTFLNELFDELEKYITKELIELER